MVGVHGDWVSHAEDLAEQAYLHKDRIIITKGGADSQYQYREDYRSLLTPIVQSPEDPAPTM